MYVCVLCVCMMYASMCGHIVSSVACPSCPNEAIIPLAVGYTEACMLQKN